MAMISLAGQWGPEGIEYTDGRHAPDVAVLVLDSAGNPAVLYTDKTRTGLAPNPARTDSLGNFSFYADAGDYSLSVHGALIPVTVAEPVGDRNSIEAAFDAAPSGEPLTLFKSGGLYSFIPQPPTAPRWGNEVRYMDGPPAADEEAPVNAVHIDNISGTYYQYKEIT